MVHAVDTLVLKLGLLWHLLVAQLCFILGLYGTCYEAFGSDPRDDSWAIYGRWE